MKFACYVGIFSQTHRQLHRFTFLPAYSSFEGKMTHECPYNVLASPIGFLIVHLLFRRSPRTTNCQRFTRPAVQFENLSRLPCSQDVLLCLFPAFVWVLVLVDKYHCGHPTPAFSISSFPPQVQRSFFGVLHGFLEIVRCLSQQVRGAITKSAR